MSIQVRVLNQKACNAIENFIRTKEPSFHPCISVRDQSNEAESYNLIKSSPNGSYSIYGSNGFRSYAHYKSNDNKIYTIEVYIQEPVSYSIIESNKLNESF
jgi:hypothetical protein